MKKKLTALFLALVMCMTVCAPAFAIDKNMTITPTTHSDSKEAIRAEIRRQLEAQDAMELYDAFVDILAPYDNMSQTYGMNATPVSYYAPQGGVTGFKREVVYRGELVTYEYAVSHFDLEDSEALLDHSSNFLLWDFLNSLFGSSLSSLEDSLGAWVTLLLKTATVAADFSEDLVEDAGGYARCVTVDSYDSCATVVTGWENYPYAVIDYTDATDRSFTYFPSN